MFRLTILLSAISVNLFGVFHSNAEATVLCRKKALSKTFTLQGVGHTTSVWDEYELITDKKKFVSKRILDTSKKERSPESKKSSKVQRSLETFDLDSFWVEEKYYTHSMSYSYSYSYSPSNNKRKSKRKRSKSKSKKSKSKSKKSKSISKRSKSHSKGSKDHGNSGEGGKNSFLNGTYTPIKQMTGLQNSTDTTKKASLSVQAVTDDSNSRRSISSFTKTIIGLGIGCTAVVALLSLRKKRRQSFISLSD